MGSYVFLFLLSALLPHLSLTIAQQRNYRAHICLDTGNYTANSTYQQNLQNLLSSVISNPTTLTNGFYNSTAGQNPDKVYALFLCRRDTPVDACRLCVNASTQDILQRCPDQKEAFIWYEQCMLRYSSRSIFSHMEVKPSFTRSDKFNNSNPDQFNNITIGLIDRLVKAASGSSRAMFAKGHAYFSIFETIYALVQCTSDISPSDCGACLKTAIRELPNCCALKRGGTVFMPSCNLKYSTNPFYENYDDDTPASSPPLTSPPLPSPRNETTITHPDKRTVSTGTIVVITISASIIVILLCIIWFLSLRRKPQEKSKCADDLIREEYLQFDLATVKASTNDFSDANKLGEGGYGSVYKGILRNGQNIAVKRISGCSGLGDRELKNEVVLLAKLHHRNVVKLLGFCLEEEEMLLIYEFVPNTSLDRFLFDPARRVELDWGRRYNIIGGIVRGLLYLHEESRLRIIHRDLKASNILLDHDMNAKISDFHMARLLVLDQSQGKTIHIVGTRGYMPPEYVMHGQFSAKSDVFSFGVLLLEIVSGKKNIKSECAEDFPSYAWRAWREGRGMDLMDPTLRESYLSSEVMRCIHIGLLCVQENVADRPTMASVALMLNCVSITLPSPAQPAFLVHGTMEPDQSSNNFDT